MEQAPVPVGFAWRGLASRFPSRPPAAGNRETEMSGRAAFAAGLVLTVLASFAPAASAQKLSGTPQEQAACRPDVAKHCKGLQGDDENVFVNCLVSHAEQLNQKCRKVLEAHGKLPA